MTRRILEPAPYNGIEEFVLPQLIGRSLLITPSDRTGRRDATYDSAEDFWRDVLDERLATERVVTLNAMRVFEWFPRNPGLFHTERGRTARKMAQYHIMGIDRNQHRNYLRDADSPPDHASLIRKITQSDEAARTTIFTPQGKLSMLQGGIGCVRYKSVDRKLGGKAWFMSASGLAPDEGIPLLVPDDIYQDLIDRIREDGFAPATLRGRVRFIPEEFRDLYSTKHGIPRLYVDVEEVKDSEEADHGYGIVSVAASFVAEIRGKEAAIYAAYVTFDPGHRGAKTSAIDWMRDEYVRGLYRGEMLTDFDQQSPSFSDTLFSLDDVMTSPDLAAAIHRLRTSYGHFDWSMLERQSINFTIDRRDMRMKVHIGGDAKNVVIGGHGSSNSLVLNEAQLQKLTRELRKAKQALKGQPDSDERDRMVGALADAEAAAKDANPEGITDALRRLKPLKDKVIDILEKVGVGLTVAAIKAAIGF